MDMWLVYSSFAQCHLEVSRQPFVQGARALGLPEWMVYTRYIFPHVGLMLLPMMGVTMGAMLGGSAVIERYSP